jgi:hypothetical protein
MKAKLIFLLFVIFITKSNSQISDNMILKNYEISTNNVVSITESYSRYNKGTNSFKDESGSVYEFDKNGFNTAIKRLIVNNSNSFISYNKDYTERTYRFNTSTPTKCYIIDTPFGYFLSSTKNVVKNSDGTIQKIYYEPEDLPKNTFSFNFIYNGKVATILPAKDFMKTKRYTNNGLLLSSKNKSATEIYCYKPNSYVVSLKINKSESYKDDLYYAYVHEFDKYGNWIVRYEYTLIPALNVNKNLLSTIHVREINYNNNETTGYKSLTAILKTKAFQNSANLIVPKIETSNLNTIPLYVDIKTVDVSIQVANTPSSPYVPEASAKCQGNCVDGYGKYTYENGYYYGFWKNGQKNGYGNYRWNAGDYFYGNWVNDKMEGFGFSKFPNGSTYTGLYSNSKYHGNAFYMNKETGKTEINYYENGKFIRSIPFNATEQTQGCTNGDCMNGYGKYAFKNGDLYIGDFQNGRMKVGTYIFVNGDIYTGNFNANNQFESYGFYLFKSSGNMYYGNWINGKRNGRGYGITNNKEEVGEWKDGVLITKMN